ncbi:LAMI_0C11056g1_1 [Lachancea mirantina]|uniref:LAMI_0C11056g1_1 n=1 Tax=Lachancea mirantina TaxID=1230905 RepID=A0A1G4J6L1_9SACH|nr:LAMI_0C11056g1_1 [Lachancea mirantina]
MQALQLTRATAGAPVILSLITTDVPTPMPGHLLIKVHASAIMPSDVLNSRGGFPYTRFPRIPGRDFAGTIAEGPRAGEEVYGTSGFTYAFTIDGFHAEYCLVREDEVARKPKNLSFAQAACVGVPFTTAALTLRKAFLKQSDTVLVIGGFGSVGSAVVQLARSKGCKVLLAARGESADVSTDDMELTAVDNLTGGQGVDVVIDTIGIPALVGAAISKLAQGGRLAFITAPRDVNLTVDMKDFYRHEKCLIGCNSLSYSAQELARLMGEFTLEFENGKLIAPREEIWEKIPLNQAVGAYQRALEDSSHKYLIVMP